MSECAVKVVWCKAAVCNFGKQSTFLCITLFVYLKVATLLPCFTIFYSSCHSELKILMQVLMLTVKIDMLNLMFMYIFYGNISGESTDACLFWSYM